MARNTQKSTVIFNYDYDRSSVNLRKDLMPNNPYITDADRGNALWNEIKANTGIKFTETDVYTYSLSGDYIETEKNFFDQSVGGNSPAYHAANYMFYKCYNIYFDPKYDSKNLY